jgi:hypothetical protein
LVRISGGAHDIFQQCAGDDAGLAWRGAAGAAGDLASARENDRAIALAATMIAAEKLNGRRFKNLVETA